MNVKRGNSLATVGIALLAAGLLGAGCATNRGILDVRVPAVQNPESARAVAIVRVTDCRVFEAAPRIASVPSLKGKEIGDQAITSRAIARKRNGYGQAIGDILLPAGRTVEDVVREALTKAFREAGYHVVEATADPQGQGQAVPIEADVRQFWAWMTPGVWAVSLQFEAQVQIKGDLAPFQAGETVRGHVELHTQAAGTRAWQNTINKGLEAFIAALKQRLAPS